MSHVWKFGDIHFNFCIKCGIKKSRALEQKCPMPNRYLDKKLPHDTVTFVGDYKQNIVICKYCELVKSDIRRIIFSKDHSHCGYVPYVLFELNGKKIAKHMLHLFYSFCGSKLINYGRPEIAYWPIYCSLSDNDRIIKDIIK